jgi:RNA polymerase sigma-70 factor (ECF subfamily)
MSNTPDYGIERAGHYPFPDVEELFRLYGDDILRVCNVYLRKRSLAEDAFQDVFVKAITKSESFRGETPVKYWLLSIARNVCKDYLKSSWLSRVGSYEEWTEDCNSEDTYHTRKHVIRPDAQEDRILDRIGGDSELMQAVKALPDKYKDVILLRFYFDLDTQEIARNLDMNESSVRSRLFRARKKLSPFMKGDEH